MTDYALYLKDFMQWCEYPPEAVDSLMQDYERLHRHAHAARVFHSLVDLFDRDLLFNYTAALEMLTDAAEAAGVPWQAVHLLFCLCLSRHTKEMYDARGIGEDVFRMSMLDMRWKLMECRKRFGIWGAIAGRWFERFFRLTRFALGRLQFEPDFARHDVTLGGHTLQKGDVVINMHIPSCGPLTREACLDSFRQAAAFFRELFPGRPVAFMCSSWLLYPEHEVILPESSNIRGFMDFFHMVETRTDNGGDLWRIFYVDDYSDLNALPQETSLQRAYVKMLQEGKPSGSGVGYFLWEDGALL